MGKIVLFTGFVGGRGSSKSFFWVYQGLLEKGYQVIVVSESVYIYKLKDLGVKPDYIINRSTIDSDKTIYEKVDKILSKISFDLMIVFSPRTYGPYYAYKKKIPYVIVEFGLPTIFEKYPSRYIGEVFRKAEYFFVLAPFGLSLRSNNLNNIVISPQPYPKSRLQLIKKIRSITRQRARKKLYSYYPELKTKSDLFIYLHVNDEYISPFNIEPFNKNYIDRWGNMQNGYLSLRGQEETYGFLARFFAGLGTKNKGKILIYTINKTKYYLEPIISQCKNIKVFSRPSPFINLEVDLFLKKSADINICRESIGDNTCDLYSVGKPVVTTIVPSGFMNEEEGVIQAKKLGTAFTISKDDLYYIDKLLRFAKNDRLQRKISKRQIEITDQFFRTDNFYRSIEKIL